MHPIPSESSSSLGVGTQPGLTLLRRQPDTLAGSLQLGVRRRLLRDWVSAQARLRGTTLIVSTRSPTTIFLALDIRHVHFLTSPSSRRPTLLVSSLDPNVSARLRLTNRVADWVRAFTTITAVPISRLSHFDVHCPIGKGGGGEVYLVNDIRNQDTTPLAMKVVQKHNVFASHSTLRRALDERLALELMRGFPFIVRLTHAFQTNSALYMLTQFCPGGDLRTLLKRSRFGRLEESVARPILAQIVLALEHIHSLNILFRDVKPENILLSAYGDVRLCDFGLCKVLSTSRLARAKSFCGSTMYMSPQIVSGSPYGFATDLWSLGALIYRVLVGRSPFELPHGLVGARNDSSDLHHRIVKDTPEVPTFVSREARQVILSLLRKQEEERMSLNKLKQSAFFADVDWDALLDDGYKRAATTYVKKSNTIDIGKDKSSSKRADSHIRKHGALIEGLNNFDSERLISHGVALEDEEMGVRRSGRLPRSGGIQERDGQPRVGRTASRVASSLSSLFQRDPGREGSNGATTIIGFHFSPTEEQQMLR